jgi:peptidyl-prolyl cis-trans isomerase B (cyclophilin B)
MLTIKTSLGDITVKLFKDKSPATVENFLKYVDSGHYNDTIFHRVIDEFMIQGGGYDLDFNLKKTGPPVKNEADNGLRNERGTIAMARTSDINSATSQFFINVKYNRFLDYRNDTPQGFGYCVFGRIKSGMNIVDKIKQVPTCTREKHNDVPEEDIIIHEIIREH